MGTVRYTVLDGEVVAEKRSGVRREYVPDPLGSTAALLDPTQSATDTFSYWPYGEESSRTGTTETPFRYVGTLGYYRDSATGEYVRARYLNVQQGRWMTEDRSGFIGGWNMFAYSGANPTTLTDASGFMPSAEPGCKEAYNVNQAIKRACEKGNRPTLSPDLQQCIKAWCSSNDAVQCSSLKCAAHKPPVIITGPTDILCGYSNLETGVITLCTGWVGGPFCDPAKVSPGCKKPKGFSTIDQVALTLLHEILHGCNMKDYEEARGDYPSQGINPTERCARRCFGVTGDIPGYKD